jgi:hypothetical protein
MMPNLATHPAILGLAAFAACAALASCGGGATPDAATTPAGGGRTLPLAAEEQRAVQRRLVGTADVRNTKAGSVQRAFLEYWSAIENEEWPIALTYFLPSIQRALKPARLMSALHNEAQQPPVKPLIRSVRTARGGQTSVRYFVRRADGRLRATSMIWRHAGDLWFIVYSSTLDDSYRAAVQAVVQGEVDPNAVKPSKQALEAAGRAANAQAEAVTP